MGNRGLIQKLKGLLTYHDATMRLATLAILLGASLAWSSTAYAAPAGSAFDGSWNLVFLTRSGDCDASYDFTVNINRGIVTHPNLVRFKGRVAPSGAVRASVTVMDKYASGSGRLISRSGRGVWSGRSGTARCSGHWTAQKN